MKVHSIPIDSRLAPEQNFDTTKHPYWNVDYWRFTKFGLITLFRDFKVIVIKETSGYIGTTMQLINYFFASFGIRYIFVPLYLVTNSIGFLMDDITALIFKNSPIPLFTKFYRLIYASWPLNYVLIVRKPLPNPTNNPDA